MARTLTKQKAKAIELSQQQGFTWVPPFDHPMVIAGQGTLALELLQQDAHLDRVFVPVGGGGLAAGGGADQTTDAANQSDRR